NTRGAAGSKISIPMMHKTDSGLRPYYLTHEFTIHDAPFDNEDLALLSGIDPKKIVMITWIIAGILATIGGALYGLDKSFKPFTYFNNMLPIFAAAIVGGIGNPFGAFLGGYVIAFSEILLTYAYRKFFMYVLPESMEPGGLVQLLSTDYKFAVSFSILVIVLLYRPSGIFKGKVL
ncbi:amino acid synthesis family protein, partial [Candidatus Pelagibacter sp.]|nr:amino acid synthesis family protein [Candidatus Pelagibacter sp.]